MNRKQLIDGKVAIVVGGGRGIGAATAIVLAQAGAAVTVAARTRAEIEAVVGQINNNGGEAIAVPTDVADNRQVEGLIQSTLSAFGRVDFLINCAATVAGIGVSTWEAEPKVWREAMNVNLLGIFLLGHAVLPHMLRQGTGRLLHVSSSAGELAVPCASGYCAARAGSNHFIRVLAAELDGTGVTANIVYPGVTDTKGLSEYREALFHTRDMPFSPYDRQLTFKAPAEAANLLLWLCSPFTAHLTNEVILWSDPEVQRQLRYFLRHTL